MATPAKKAKLDSTSTAAATTSKRPCPYGANCYRKNPAHFQEFSHPKDGDSATKDSKSDLSSFDTSTLPVCKFGAKCYRKNLLHFAEYSHPTGTAAADDSGSDTDVCDSDDDKDKKTDSKKDDKDVLNRGMSLVKSFSQMTEAERKELIQKAMEAKQKLKEELEATKKQVEEKDKELNRLQEEVNKGMLLVEGESEALDSDKTVYFPLHAERDYKEGSAAQIHFRLAESQFYRLLTGGASATFRVSKVEYVVTPFLVKRFKAAREKLKKERGEEMSYPVLAFHGTNESNITPICETGFKVPGESGFHHKTDTGWYGAGVYFSEYPSYSMGYIAGSTKLLLCQVLPGKVFHCTKLIHGAKLTKGYDSHMSPCKKELVVFNSHHILPCYVVHYTNAVTDFQYQKKAPGYKRKRKKGGAGAPKVTPGDVFAKQMKAHNAPASSVNPGTTSSFDILVATPEKNESNSVPVKTALEKDIPVVTEDFVYECIIQKKSFDPDYFLHSLYDD
ncbi:hypothetical protein BaRGS_00027538 [Batillaria attramentaria]|uniref:Poly [ADP-ribose] polymerase n=1 Tax=Batillaria attramentaria TaxID=370345 RepID=A0ABD0K293_9CAEN